MILERDYIEQQDLASCEALLAQAVKNKQIDKNLITNKELWPEVDSLANTLCWLEDRIAYLRQLINLEKANAARWDR